MNPKIKFRIAIAASSFLACLFITSSLGSAQQKPNIVLVMLDDANIEDTYIDFHQTQETYFPNIKALAQNGIRFTNAHCTTPLCGPSRAAFMRSQYAHNVGIRVNNPDIKQSQSFGGGYLRYKAQGFTNDDLGTWIKGEGYKNYFVGKYLHTGYNDDLIPGFDEFYASLGSKYFGVTRSINGKRAQTTTAQYRTKIETDDVVRFIEEHQTLRKENGQPFFMIFTPFAPHDVSLGDELGMVEPKYKSLWSGKLAPKPDNYSEANILDKPAVYQRLPRLNNIKRVASNKLHRSRMRSMKSIDDSIGRIRSKLESLGELDNTYIILMSDNGYLNGHHRAFGKMDPYDRSTRIPLIVSGPGVAKNKVANHLVAHIDVSSTIVKLAGGTPKEFVDGKAFDSLLDDPGSVTASTWRDPILIENYQVKQHHTPSVADFIQLQMSYLSVRTYDEVYTEWSTGEKEHYDLTADPLQLTNTYTNLSSAEKSIFESLLAVARDANVKPKTYIAKPHEPFTASPMQIKGLAEAAGGVSQVRLMIKNINQNEFWNGTEWQSDSTTVTANVSGDKGLLANWDYTVPLTEDQDDDRILVTARAYDDSGNFAGPSIPIIVARVDGDNPNTTIAKPARNSTIARTNVLVQGQATDNYGMDRVRLMIQHVGNGRYWNGVHWQNGKHEIIIEARHFGQRKMNWRYQFTPPGKAKIKVFARAYDRVNNRDLTPAIVVFNVK